MRRMEKCRIQMEERKEQKKARLKAHAELRRKQVIEGLSGTRRITADNAKSEYTTYSEEIDARQEMAKDYLKVLQRSLPGKGTTKIILVRRDCILTPSLVCSTF